MRMSKLVEQLKPYMTDAESYGRLSADFNDLLEACDWLQSLEKRSNAHVFTPSELESLMIEVDVKFIQHVTFHMKSLKKDLQTALKRFPDGR